MQDRPEQSTSNSVIVTILISFASGLGLIWAARKFANYETFGSEFKYLFFGLAAILILWGIKQSSNLLNPTRTNRHRKRASRQQIGVPREGAVYLLIMGVMFVGSLLGRSNMLMLVFAMMAGPFILNGWLTYMLLRQTKLRRQMPKRCMAGESVSIEIQLESRKRWLSTWLMAVNDTTYNETELLQAGVLFARVPPSESRSAYYQLQLANRGKYEFGPMLLTTRFPLGLVERGKTFEVLGDIIVHPRIGKLAPEWQRSLMISGDLAIQQRPRVGSQNDEFHRLREYREGDNPTAIHWRTSARRNELMVREFHQSRDQPLIVLLDLFLPKQAFAADRDRVELAISFVATVCVEQLSAGHTSQLSLIANGTQVDQWDTQTNGASLESLLDLLAGVQAGTADHVDEMSDLCLQYRTSQHQIVLITTQRSKQGQFQGLDDQSSHRTIAESGIPMHVIEADAQQMSAFFMI